MLTGLAGEAAVTSEAVAGSCINALRAIDALLAADSVPETAQGLSLDERDRLRLHHARAFARIDAKVALIHALRNLRNELRRQVPT